MIAFSVAGIAVSGTDVQAVNVHLRGLRDPRLLVTNTGPTSLSAAKVGVKVTEDGPAAAVDTTTLASLANGETKSVLVPGPVEWLELLVTCGAGTALNVSVTDGIGW